MSHRVKGREFQSFGATALNELLKYSNKTVNHCCVNVACLKSVQNALQSVDFLKILNIHFDESCSIGYSKFQLLCTRKKFDWIYSFIYLQSNVLKYTITWINIFSWEYDLLKKKKKCLVTFFRQKGRGWGKIRQWGWWYCLILYVLFQGYFCSINNFGAVGLQFEVLCKIWVLKNRCYNRPCRFIKIITQLCTLCISLCKYEQWMAQQLLC